MRILFALHAYLPDGKGGTETHVASLAKVLARQHAVRVVAREGDPNKPDFAVTKSVVDGIEVVHINNLYANATSFGWIYKNEKIHELFERELVDFRPDLVHVHHLTGLSSTIVETIKAGGLPLVMTLHDFWTVCPRGQRITKELDICETVDRNLCFHCLAGIWPQMFADRKSEPTELDTRGKLAPASLATFDRHMQYILGLADVLITPSEYHRERMLEFQLPIDRMVALPHGLDHGPFRNAAAMRHPRPVKRIGYIGSVIPIKGVHILMDAFRILGRSDIELHIHGDAFAFHDDRNYSDRLQARAIGHPNIHFDGPYRPVDLPRILSNLDILVVPSLWWETFCLTIREGLLAGVPVLASDLGAMREALDGEENGLLFKAGDARDLADRLTQLIADDSLRTRLTNRAHTVKTIEVYAEELLALYDRAMATSAARASTIVVAPSSFPAKGLDLRKASLRVQATDAKVRVSGRRLEDNQLRVTLADASGASIGELAIVGQGERVALDWDSDQVVPVPKPEPPDARRQAPPLAAPDSPSEVREDRPQRNRPRESRRSPLPSRDERASGDTPAMRDSQRQQISRPPPAPRDGSFDFDKSGYNAPSDTTGHASRPARRARRTRRTRRSRDT